MDSKKIDSDLIGSYKNPKSTLDLIFSIFSCLFPYPNPRNIGLFCNFILINPLTPSQQQLFSTTSIDKIGPAPIELTPIGQKNFRNISNIIANAAVAAVLSQASIYDKQRHRTSFLDGHENVHEVWNSGYAQYIQKIFRIGFITLGQLQY